MTSKNSESIVSIRNVSKTYKDGFVALTGVNLEIKRGEIFALLGPNGAGKTSLINLVSGIVKPSVGEVSVDGYDIIRDYRVTRSKIGLVPQELATDMFETPWNVVSFSRGLFGKPSDPARVEKSLRDLSLWDKKDNEIRTLSGGMKRRVMIAKALAHDPIVLFLDEPTAGVDVNLRREMWDLVGELRAKGVTIILTTHYIDEAEAMADRIGVINGGKIIVVEEKAALMKKLGKKQLVLHLDAPLKSVPAGLEGYQVALADEGTSLVFTYDASAKQAGVAAFMKKLDSLGVVFKDLQTKESSLEDIFLNLLERSS